MRLIDADKLKTEIHRAYSDDLEICEKIDNQPTAYDVDKVVNQIEKKMFSAECYNNDFNGCEIGNLLCMGDVYEIVKGGGVDE